MFFLYVVFFELLIAVATHAMQEKEYPLSPPLNTPSKEEIKRVRKKVVNAQENADIASSKKLGDTLRFYRKLKFRNKK